MRYYLQHAVGERKVHLATIELLKVHRHINIARVLTAETEGRMVLGVLIARGRVRLTTFNTVKTYRHLLVLGFGGLRHGLEPIPKLLSRSKVLEWRNP